MELFIGQFGKINRDQVRIQVLTFVELLDILEQAGLNRVVIQCAPRIRGDRSDGSHLSAVVVLEQKLHIIVQRLAIIPQVGENDVEAGADAGI